MNQIKLIIIALTISFTASSQTAHVNYLKENSNEPSAYLNHLFSQNDLVFLCERRHTEMTQYDFIQEIISTDWFIKNVGFVITEMCTRTIQDKLDSLLLSEDLPSDELQNALISICRNNSVHTLWHYSSFYNFVKHIYELNQKLEGDDKVRLIGADISYSWDSIKSKNDAKIAIQHNRDTEMGQFIVDWYNNDSTRKALVIMNTRHAYFSKYSAAKYTKWKLPHTTTNVYLNECSMSGKLINKGVWDNSFETLGNKPMAFKLKGSPFGKDPFDHFYNNKQKLIWEEVFDHLVFYNPIEEMYTSTGVSGLVTSDFEAEYNRRHKFRWYRKPKTFFQRRLRNSKHQEIKIKLYRKSGNRVYLRKG